MNSVRRGHASVLVLSLCALTVLCACAPVSITIGTPPTTTPVATLPPTATAVASATIPSATDTPVPFPVTGPTATATQPSAASASPTPQPTLQPPPSLTPQPPPQQQPTVPAAPAKPSDFKATGTGTNIEFTWTDKSTNELGFRIYQVGQVAPVVSQPQHTGTGGMSYTWTGRPCALSASFYIRAFNDAGESASSDSDSAVTIPCQPTNLTGSGSGTSINFNWAVAAGHNESGFHIYQEGVSAPVGSRGPNLGSGGTIFALTSSCNVSAGFSVRAYNSAGESASSNSIQAKTIPCGPTSMHITSVTKDTVNYAWTDNATNEDGFHVYRDDALYITWPVHAGTGVIAKDAVQQCDFNFPVTHVYSVRAYNSAGESNVSEHVGATTPKCP